MATLLSRSTSKQSFTQGAKIVLKDSLERLEAWADALNGELGWNKYKAAE